MSADQPEKPNVSCHRKSNFTSINIITGTVHGNVGQTINNSGNGGVSINIVTGGNVNYGPTINNNNGVIMCPSPAPSSSRRLKRKESYQSYYPDFAEIAKLAVPIIRAVMAPGERNFPGGRPKQMRTDPGQNQMKAVLPALESDKNIQNKQKECVQVVKKVRRKSV